MKKDYSRLSQQAANKHRLSRLAVAGLLTTGLLLGGCQSGGPSSADEQAYTNGQILIQQAEQLVRQSARQASPQRELLRLEAAEIFAQQQQLSKAQQTLDTIDQSRLSLAMLARYNLLGAELALADDNFFTAHDLLTHPALEQHWQELPIATQQQWHQYRAEVFDLLGDEQRSIDEYIALSATLNDPKAISDIHQKLWVVLSHMPQKTLDQLIDSEPNRVRRGWYTLAGTSRQSHGDIFQLRSELDKWRSDWSWHPAALSPPAGLDTIEEIADNLPRNLALMLPMSGQLKTAGSTVLDGFMAAYYEVLARNGTPPNIKVYDTDSGEAITELYQRAVVEGADLVIGPLKKERVAELNQLSNLPIPSVSLNYLTDEETLAAENLFQFGISVADEARQVAQRAWLEGHRNAFAIVPDTDLGKRTLAAFRTEWENRGGTLVVDTAYPKNLLDFSKTIKPALLVDQSQTRAKQLSRLLGKSLKASPERRRRDLDMVFVHANPVQGRQIKPMLDFFYAADVPVYATSQIYSGAVDPGKDRDLDKIKFCAMPWTLPGTIADDLKPDTKLHPSYQQLYALGLDAYQIHQGVLQMEALPNTRLFGSTGTLRLEQGRILRDQPWAVFRNGRVKAARRPTEG